MFPNINALLLLLALLSPTPSSPSPHLETGLNTLHNSSTAMNTLQYIAIFQISFTVRPAFCFGLNVLESRKWLY
jgi:hypothetical protein